MRGLACADRSEVAVYVSIYLVRVLMAEVRRRGIREDAFLALAGITPEQIADPAHRLPLDRYDAAVRATRACLRDEPNAALEVGTRWPIGGYLMGHLFSNAPTLREALGLVGRYGRLVHEGMRLAVIEAGDETTVVYENPVRAPDNAGFESEVMLSFLLRVGQLLTGYDLPPIAVSFAHDAADERTDYRRAFGIEPEFGARRDALRFARKLLDVPNAHHDPTVSVLLERRASELLAAQDDDARLVERVRDLIRLVRDPQSLRADDLAARLGTSSRALQRRLRARGTSLSSLLDETQKTMAIEAVRSSSAPLKQIADRLGFSEPSAFHRAFKRWTGKTPRDFRLGGASN